MIPASIPDQMYDGFISYSHAADDLLAPWAAVGVAAVRQAVVEAAGGADLQ